MRHKSIKQTNKAKKNMNQYSHFQPNTRHLVTKADLGKVYIDMQGQQRTIDQRIIGECLVAYVVTNKWGKSEIAGK